MSTYFATFDTVFTSYWQLLGFLPMGGLAISRHFELLLTIDVVLPWRSTEQRANLRAVTSRQNLPRIGLLSLRNSNSIPKWRSSSFCTNNNARSVNRLTSNNTRSLMNTGTESSNRLSRMTRRKSKILKKSTLKTSRQTDKS